MYTVTKVKTFQGMEGAGFNATLCKDGEPIALVIDEGCGGCYLCRWLDRAAEAPFKAHVKQVLPNEDFEAEDMFIARLIDEWETNRQLKRWCKTKVLFRLKGDRPDEWRNLLAPYSPAAVAHLHKKYDPEIEEIANERFLEKEAVCAG